MIKLDKKQWSGASIILIGVLTPLMLINGGFDNLVVYIVNTALAIGLCFVFDKNQAKGYKMTYLSPCFWMILLMMWGFFSVLWSVHTHRTLVEATQLLMGFLIYMLARKVQQQEDRQIIHLLCVVGVGASILSTIQFIMLNITEGTIAHKNPFSFALVVISLMTWGKAVKEQKIKWASIVACGIMLSQVLVVSSRMSLLALVIVSPLLFIGLNKHQLKGKILETIGTIGTMLIFAKLILTVKYLVKNSNLSLIQTVVRKSSLNGSFVTRLSFFRQALNMFKHQPLKGHGLGTFFLADNILLPDSGFNSRFVHNHYLQMMAELGAVGLILFAGMIVTMYLVIVKQIKRKEYNYNYGYMAGFIAFTIHIISDFTLNFPACIALFYLLIGFITRDTEKIILPQKKYVLQNKIFLVLALIMTLYIGIPSWQYSQIAKEPSIDMQIKRMSQVNQIYPMNSGAHAFVSERYEYKYKETGNKADLELAISEAEKAVRWCPVDGKIYQQLGQLYLQANETEKAEQAMILARNHAGTDLSRYIDLAYFYMWKNDYQQARDVLTDGIDKAKKFTQFERKHAVTNHIEQMTNLLSDIESKE